MTHLTIRPYSGAADLRRMQRELIRSFDQTTWRIGDYAWQSRSSTHYDLSIQISLVFDGEDHIGWTWLKPRGGFHAYLIPERRFDTAVWERLLEEIESTASARLTAGDTLENLYVWFVEETDLLRGLLTTRGFTQMQEGGGDVLWAADLSSVSPQTLPDGHSLGWVAEEVDLPARVEVHRSAFAPSEFTLTEYRRARRTWPYRPELDRIVRAPNGEIVAAAIAWLDEENRCGLIEPVAVDPAHHGRGLGRAVVADALIALREAGASRAQIGTSGPAAKAAYMAAGFEPWKRETTFQKRLTGS